MSERLIVGGWPLLYGGRTYRPGEEIARKAIPPGQIPALLANGGLRVEGSDEDVGAAESPEGVLALSIPALKAEIASWASPEALDALLTAETEGRSRAGALEAIEDRIAELEEE